MVAQVHRKFGPIIVADPRESFRIIISNITDPLRARWHGSLNVSLAQFRTDEKNTTVLALKTNG